MLTLAAYRLETPLLSEEELHQTSLKVENAVNTWLESKGVNDISSSAGSFDSQAAGNNGSYERHHTSSQSGKLFELSLSEPTGEGYVFKLIWLS